MTDTKVHAKYGKFDLFHSLTSTAQNAYTRQCITVLRQISVLNHTIVQTPPVLSSLQASFRGKNSFSHIQRLHNMLYAYGATVVEIVRRKEFCEFIFSHSSDYMISHWGSSTILLPAGTEYPGSHGKTLVSAFSPFTLFLLYMGLSARARENGVKFIAGKSTGSSHLRHVGWMIPYRRSISHRPVIRMPHILWSAKTSMVWITPCAFPVLRDISRPPPCFGRFGRIFAV